MMHGPEEGTPDGELRLPHPDVDTRRGQNLPYVIEREAIEKDLGPVLRGDGSIAEIIEKIRAVREKYMNIHDVDEHILAPLMYDWARLKPPSDLKYYEIKIKHPLVSTDALISLLEGHRERLDKESPEHIKQFLQLVALTQWVEMARKMFPEMFNKNRKNRV